MRNILVLCFIIFQSQARAVPLRYKRAFSYIANETACTVDHIVYKDGDPIPTDDPCESCKCRPPGFSCVLRECEVKTGCKAIRRDGECCPEYQCGCEHNGHYYRDGDRIPNAESPCYSCYCQGSSITCSLADCKFRFDCEPEYLLGECCPRYDHCPPEYVPNSVTVKSTIVPILTTLFTKTTTPLTTFITTTTPPTTTTSTTPSTTTTTPSTITTTPSTTTTTRTPSTTITTTSPTTTCTTTPVTTIFVTTPPSVTNISSTPLFKSTVLSSTTSPIQTSTSTPIVISNAETTDDSIDTTTIESVSKSDETTFGISKLPTETSSESGVTEDIKIQTISEMTKPEEILIQTSTEKSKSNEITTQSDIVMTTESPTQTELNKTEEILTNLETTTKSEEILSQTEKIPIETNTEVIKTEETTTAPNLGVHKESEKQTEPSIEIKFDDITTKPNLDVSKTEEIPTETYSEISKAEEITLKPISDTVNAEEVSIETNFEKSKTEEPITKTEEPITKTEEPIIKTEEIPTQKSIEKSVIESITVKPNLDMDDNKEKPTETSFEISTTEKVSIKPNTDPKNNDKISTELNAESPKLEETITIATNLDTNKQIETTEKFEILANPEIIRDDSEEIKAQTTPESIQMNPDSETENPNIVINVERLDRPDGTSDTSFTTSVLDVSSKEKELTTASVVTKSAISEALDLIGVNKESDSNENANEMKESTKPKLEQIFTESSISLEKMFTSSIEAITNTVFSIVSTTPSTTTTTTIYPLINNETNSSSTSITDETIASETTDLKDESKLTTLAPVDNNSSVSISATVLLNRSQIYEKSPEIASTLSSTVQTSKLTTVSSLLPSYTTTSNDDTLTENTTISSEDHVCRLTIRLLDGTQLTHEFDARESLFDAKNYVISQKLVEGNFTFVLPQMSPINEQNMINSLRVLGLCPSADVHVIRL